MRWLLGKQKHAWRFPASLFRSQFGPGRSYFLKPPLPPPHSTRCPHLTLHSRGYPSILVFTHLWVRGWPWTKSQSTDGHRSCWISIVPATVYKQSSLNHNRRHRWACNWFLEGLLGLETHCWFWGAMVSYLYSAPLANGSSQSFPIYFSPSHRFFLSILPFTTPAIVYLYRHI